MIRKVFTLITHFITDIVIQLKFFIMMVFFYDYSVKNVVISFAFGIVLLYVDYFACNFILAENRLSTPRYIHFVDLIWVIPNLALQGYCIIPDIINSGTIKHVFSYYEFSLMMVNVLFDLCLVIERLKLIRPTKQ